MRGRTIMAVAAPVGLLLGLAGAKLADPAMQDRTVNPYVDDGRTAFALQERPRQPSYDVRPQDLNPRGSYRPEFDYEAEVWDSDIARMEADRRGFHIDDYYAERDAARAQAEQVSTAPIDDAAAQTAATGAVQTASAATAAKSAPEPVVRVTSGNDAPKPQQVASPQDGDGMPGIY